MMQTKLILNRQDTFRELFISIAKLRLTPVKQIFTNGNGVKTTQQSSDLIGLRMKLPIEKAYRFKYP